MSTFITLTILSLTFLLSGCDCWSEVNLTVTLAEGTPDSEGELLVVSVARINDADVTGTDGEGIPTGDGNHSPDSTGDVKEGVRSYDYVETAAPFSTWMYSFIDTNGNKILDSGEYFGVNADNPVDLSDCDTYDGGIIIDRQLSLGG